MNYGFVKVASGVPEVRVADPKYNVQQIEKLIIQAEGHGVELICTPELSITGYSCGDLFGQQLLLDNAEMAVIHLLNFSRSLDIISVVGLPVSYKGMLLNCAAVIQKGKILGLVPKTFLPNYKEFYERRWFSSATELPEDASVLLCGQQVRLSSHILFRTPNCYFGIELCEDLWAPIPPSSKLALQGADIILNLSADDDVVGKYSYLQHLLRQQSARCIAGYVYAAAGFGESTQDVVYSGKAIILENGKQLAEGKRHSLTGQLLESEIDVELLRTERRMNTTFGMSSGMNNREERDSYTTIDTALITTRDFDLTRSVNPAPFVPKGPALDQRCQEIFDIQAEGLARRLQHIGTQTVVIGISGGLDSTLALLVCTRAFDLLGLDRRGIVGITMPGFGTSDRTYNNACDLMHELGITSQEISIAKSVTQHFEDINHDPTVQDVTYENSQARERTQILMDVANQLNGIVVGTGDLSELALGWCTYNGDHMSMYGVNTGVPKTLVRHLVRWVAEHHKDGSAGVAQTLLDIVDTPISPELIPTNDDGLIQQKTEDLVGPYELHDFFLYNALRWGFRPAKIYYLARYAFGESYRDDELKHWLQTFYRRFFSQQFKRSCLPDGPKVGTISLSPRGDWRMPSDACRDAWLAECDAL
ncbi:MAG: NAD(+) synthase [Bacteroidaceae bacterium]|nr:NAD(+) synthase [Bacteroidaceae bacterium]